MTDREYIKRLACALAAYETDAPHTGEWADEKPHFPEYTWHQLNKWSGQPHDGDCTNQPHTCMRCWSEAIIDKAEFLAGRVKQND